MVRLSRLKFAALTGTSSAVDILSPKRPLDGALKMAKSSKIDVIGAAISQNL